MTDDGDGLLVHISTQTMSTMGPDGPNGGGMTHTCWSPRSLEELVAHYTDILDMEPDWKDGKAVFVQTNESGRSTEETVTVVEEALGHREAPPRAESIVTIINTKTMQPVEAKILAPEPIPPRTRWWRRLRSGGAAAAAMPADR